MGLRARRVLMFVDKTGRAPFDDWLIHLKDIVARSIIRARIRRIEIGNVGVYKWVGGGVLELKISFAPGYRVYFGEDGKNLDILLCGGDKSTQKRDIPRAHNYWKEYRRENEKNEKFS